MTQTWPLKALTSGETLAALADTPINLETWATVLGILEDQNIVLARRVEPATKIQRVEPPIVADPWDQFYGPAADARGLS
jgi:hypothetical protein